MPKPFWRGSAVLSLRDLQAGFADAIFDKDNHRLDNEINPNGLTGSQRLSVYRNNVFIVLSKTLASTYPVVERLVGEGFFRYAANRYIHQYPSQSGDLTDYGDRFPTFLETFEPAAQLVYLPDMARLEWAYHQAYHAAGHAPLDIIRLQSVDPARYEQLMFRLHPSARLLTSRYPVQQIWQVSQAEFTGDQSVDINSGGVLMLLIRSKPDVEMQTLIPAEFAFLQALADNAGFATACEKALETQPDFDVTGCFQKHVLQETLVDFSF
jgi:hypothetical protein